MTSIRIQRKRDADTPLLPEITKENYQGQGTLEVATILEGGMENGKTSIGFAIKTEEGKYLLVQTSANVLRGIVSALDGAEANWRDNP